MAKENAGKDISAPWPKDADYRQEPFVAMTQSGVQGLKSGVRHSIRAACSRSWMPPHNPLVHSDLLPTLATNNFPRRVGGDGGGYVRYNTRADY